MIKRLIDVTQPAYISLRHKQLTIEPREGDAHLVPIEDVAVLLLSNPQITITQSAQTACSDNNTVILCCNEKFLPSAITLPLEAHALTGKIARLQVAAPAPISKRLWQVIVRRKIHEQALTLDLLGAEAACVRNLIDKVKSGDTSNVEALAARIYWQRLFGAGFRRRPDAPGVNTILNYGYAVVRAAVARATVGAGLCPIFGIKHSNQYNHLSLVDDLVEPFRPWVDSCVAGLIKNLPEDEVPSIGKEQKQALLGLLQANVRLEGRALPMMVALHSYTADVRGVLCQEQKTVRFPER